jgi:hypothetical protein
MTLEGLNDDFRDLLILFADSGVEFVVVGAFALSFHGAPRASGDIDLFVRAESNNADRVFGALARFGAPLVASGVTSADFARSGIVYQIGLPPRRIDILTQISWVTFDEAWTSRVSGYVAGRRIAFFGREALHSKKHATGRAKDLADAARLRRKR